jgi:hypothetical protein
VTVEEGGVDIKLAGAPLAAGGYGKQYPEGVEADNRRKEFVVVTGGGILEIAPSN